MKKIFWILLCFIALLSNCSKEKKNTGQEAIYEYTAQDDSLKMNQIQIIASHNSYRIRTDDTILGFLKSLQSMLPANLNPDDLDYTHENFDVQFSNYQIRGLEIDIYNDATGSDFYKRRVNAFVDEQEESGIQDLKTPGAKVLHIKDVDFNTHYYTFKQSLEAIKRWSDANPRHLPIFVNVETKLDAPGDEQQLADLGFQKAAVWDAQSADALDQEIRDVFGTNMDKVMTPDKLRGNFATLKAMAESNAWPTLREARGKIVFILEGSLSSFYAAGHPSLSGRAMFMYASFNSPEAAFLIRNGSVSQKNDIIDKVSRGFIVRTRADSGTNEARTGNYAPMYAAFESGAQIISTDYYKPDPRGGVDPGWTTFKVAFPNGEKGRKNPVNAVNVNVESRLED